VAPLIDGIAAAYNIVRAAIHAVRGLLRLGGALVRMAIAGFLALFGKLAGGWVGLLTSAATTLAGKAALQFAAGVGYVLEGFGWGLLTRWSYEQHFAIWDWCGGNRGQCDAPPASGYWSYN
jgi:hypothetical protein